MLHRFIGIALLSGFALIACATSGAQESAPEGLWQWAAPVAIRDARLTIDCTASPCKATLNGKTVPLEREGDRFEIDGPDELGFVGHAGSATDPMTGWWQQTADHLAYSTVRTPARLDAVAEGRWSGLTELQHRSFRITLDVFEDETGGLRAVLHNPERNEILGSRPFRLTGSEETGWAFDHPSGNREEGLSLFRNGDGTLRLNHPFFQDALHLSRTSPERAEGYFARMGGRDAAYAAPEPVDGGWRTASAEELGFDTASLDRMVETLATADPRQDRPVQLHAILAAKGDTLFLEEYFHGFGPEDRHDVRSLGKVFGPVMLGALDHGGASVDMNTPAVSDYLASLGDASGDPRRDTITTAHLMTYSSGLDCSESGASPGSEDRMWEQQAEPDFWRFFAGLPVRHTAGQRYAYCSGSANMVGSVVRAIANKPVFDVFHDMIAEPLRFGPYHWNLAPNGEAYLGGGAYIRPRDLLKVGAAYAKGGEWNGIRIASEGWVAESTRTHLPITPATTGLSQEDFDNEYFGGGQAYIWRTDTVRVGDRRYDSFEASGNGGQLIIVVPELDLSVVMVGGNYRQGSIWGRWRDELVGRYVIPAMLGNMDGAPGP